LTRPATRAVPVEGPMRSSGLSRETVSDDPGAPLLLARVLEAAPVGVALVRAPGTIAWANAAYFEVTGRDRAILGTDFHAIPDDDGTWSRPIRIAVDAALAEGTAATFRGVRARHRASPRGIYLDVDVRPMDAAGRPSREALLLVRDVTDRVQERERADLFYASFQSSTNAMQLTDARGVMVDVNPAYEKIYGYTRAECVGRRPNLVRSHHTPAEVYDRMWESLLDPKRRYWSGELLNRDRWGRERPVLLTITAIRDPQRVVTHYLGVAVDLSEQRSWEMRAAHADRLASVGQLAAGVAHEINTPLANVMLVAESIRRRAEDPWVLDRLGTMTEQIESAARIVRGLLDFARREEPHTTDLDLVEVVRAAVEFLRGKQSADVALRLEFPQGPVGVRGDRGSLIQVITNLLNNAYDAIAGVGTIQVEVRRRAGRAEVDIVDSGPGIPPEVLPRIFEPFFTTKPEGQGTGLGLAICHGIVQSHHGTITARNVPGAGAGFLVSLPGVGSGAPPATGSSSTPLE
jgi:PAS domain S-box-containing protein